MVKSILSDIEEEETKDRQVLYNSYLGNRFPYVSKLINYHWFRTQRLKEVF